MEVKHEFKQQHQNHKIILDRLNQNKHEYHILKRIKYIKKTEPLLQCEIPRTNSIKNEQLIYKRKIPIKSDNSIIKYIKVLSQTMQNFSKTISFFHKKINKIKKIKNDNYLITKKYVINKKYETNKIKYIQKYWKKFFNKISTMNKIKYINNNTVNIINGYNYNYEFQYIDLSDNKKNSSFTHDNSSTFSFCIDKFNPINNKIKKINNFNSIILKNILTKSSSYKNKNKKKHLMPFYRKRFPFYLNKLNNEKKKYEENKSMEIKNDIEIWVKHKLDLIYNNKNMFKFKKTKSNKYIKIFRAGKNEKKLFLNYERYNIINKPNLSKKLVKMKSYANVMKFKVAEKYKYFSQKNMKNRNFILNRSFNVNKKIINKHFVNQINSQESLLLLERKSIMKKPYMK